MRCYLINLEEGMPTVASARVRLDQALRTAKARRYDVMKIIHGYGSSGRGGAIKSDVLTFLAEKCRSSAVRAYVAGGDFSPFSPDSRKITAAFPELLKDSDYARGNDGITIVLL